MRITKTTIPGVLILEPQVFGDERGYFCETYNQKLVDDAVGRPIRFVQDNESKSSYGVLRGFAYQAAPHTQAKLVRVTQGRVLDVVLDIRKNSPTFGQHVATELSADNKKQLFLPRGVAHAFVTLSETAVFNYKVDNFFNLESERGVIYSDPALGINWQVPAEHLKVSAKDLSRPVLAQTELFEYGSDFYE